VQRVRWISACILALGLSVPSRAFAQNDKAAAEALFDDAKKLMEAKRYPEACKKFADSQKLDPGVGTLLNLGLCYKQSGQTASAWSAYREAASLARSEGQPDREDLAREEAKNLEPTLTKLVIEVTPETAALPGLDVRRDGAPVPQGLWGVPAPVDPGVRAIDVTAPGKKPLHLETRTEGAGTTAHVLIPQLEAGPPPPPEAAAQPGPPLPVADSGKPAENPGKTQRIVGYVLGGAGIVAVGVGTWFVLYAHAQDQVGDKSDEQDRADRYHGDADTSRTVGFITIGGGAALIAGGVVLIATAPSSQKVSLTVLPEVAHDRAGFRLFGRF
jgi:hypothetical protein